MTITVDLWQAISALLALGGALVTVFSGMLHFMFKAFTARIDEKFQNLAENDAQQYSLAQRVERELLEMKAEVARDYVRREDYNQTMATILTRIDALGLRIENILLKGGVHDR